MSYVFNISTLSFEQIAELITECNIQKIDFKQFYGQVTSYDNDGAMMELPWSVTINNESDALFAQLKWNLSPNTDTTLDI